MGRKKEAGEPEVDDGRVLLDARSPDGGVRGEAVRSLCPCHAGWRVFERHVGIVLRAMRDADRGMRAHALHVFEDAARMQFAEEADYRRQEAEEAARRKRASRFRPEEGGAEARRRREISRRRRRR